MRIQRRWGLVLGVAWLAALAPPALAAPSLRLDPSAATRSVGEDHTVTATLTDGGAPLAGEDVVFQAIAGFNGLSSCDGSFFNRRVETGADGRAACTFGGFVGSRETIRAWHDAGGDGAFDPDEATDTAALRWLSPPPASLTIDHGRATP